MNAQRQAQLTAIGKSDLQFLGMSAVGEVNGRLLSMGLQQRYRNSSDTNIEINYTFPLPWGAVLMHVEVSLNGQILKGNVTSRNDAQEKYEEALSEGDSSIMLEKNADHSYTLALGNLMPNEECNISIHYAQVLQFEQGQVRLMLPTTLAPRYGNPLTQGGKQPHQVGVPDLTAEYRFEIAVTLHGELAKANVESPSHKTGYFPSGDSLVVRLAQKSSLDRDFILTISDLQKHSIAVVGNDSKRLGQSAAMVSFVPRLPRETTPEPVTMKILVDCSGSMAGDSIEAARRALAGIVRRLERVDKFSLSRFGGLVEHRSKAMWSCTDQAKISAQRWIDNLQADLGGTEMAEALLATFGIAHRGRCDVLLVTDGSIEGIDEVITVASQSQHRVFVVGIGASPAEAHLRRLAQSTGGACDFVAPGEAVEPAVLRMFNRLRTTPIEGLRIEWPKAWSLRWAKKLPTNVFDSDSLHIEAVFDGAKHVANEATAKLWGRINGEKAEKLLAEAPVRCIDDPANTLARMAASSQYMECSTNAKNGETSSTTALELALDYQLMTDETNFILVHQIGGNEKAIEMPDGHTVRPMLAAGHSGIGLVGKAIGKTATLNHVNAIADSFRITGAASGLMVSGAVASSGAFATYKLLNKIVLTRSHNQIQPIDRSNPLYWSQDASIRVGLIPQNLDDYSYVGATPAGLNAWCTTNAPNLWPKTYPDLRGIGLGISICEWLEFEVGRDRDEEEVVKVFLSLIIELSSLERQMGRKVLQAVTRVFAGATLRPSEAAVANQIRKALSGMVGTTWPKNLISFPTR